MMQMLDSEGIISVLVEGGRQILDAFIEAGMWDMARIGDSTMDIWHTCRRSTCPCYSASAGILLHH